MTSSSELCRIPRSPSIGVGKGVVSARSVAMRLQREEEEDSCNFCCKRPRQVRFLVEGANARVCDECLDLCAEILAEEFEV